MKIGIKGLLPLFFLAAIWGCNKEGTDIGVNLRPDGGLINSITEELTLITCRTISEDSIRTDSLNSNILGAINDPEFGTSVASLIMQPRIDESGFDLNGNTIDSAVLTLKYDKAQILGGIENVLSYGDLSSEIEIDVYKLDETLDVDRQYYSNFNPVLGSKIGSFKGTFNFFDSVWVKINGDSSRVSPQLNIRLNNSFGQEMLDQPASTYASVDDFLTYLKGIVLVPKSNLASGKGAIVGIDLRNSNTRLSLYYNDSLSTNIPVGPSSERINFYSVTSQSSITNQQMGSGHYNSTYVQAMGGPKVKIDIPDLDAFISKGEKVVINEAEITFTLDQSKITTAFPAPKRLLLLRPHPDDARPTVFIDYVDAIFPPQGWTGYTNYGGLLESDQYTFHFNRYLQELVDEHLETGMNNFRGFYLSIPSDFPITPSRAVLKTDPTLGEVKVSITYTKLN
ncbi:MAG: hypothetical protein RLZZ337_763 [Bacteroidota bacterium]|jgi:hypothetical protein